jgi:hypothetical protein
MDKRIVFLSYYFEPDLCAGSFRNTSLLKELKHQIDDNTKIDVYTTLPNRYDTFKSEAKELEIHDKIRIFRISTPIHGNGMFGQMKAFKKYFKEVLSSNKDETCDLVYASSSRLFTAFLGAILANKKNAFLYLDIRDIFKETILDTLKIKSLSGILSLIISLIEKYTFRRANHINLISPGFQEYFKKYSNKRFSYFTNGIDEIFLKERAKSKLKETKEVFDIVYAGNIGWSQGLHKVIPQAAKELGEGYRFTVIGDGGAKSELILGIKNLEINNVKLFNPIKRKELKNIYANSDCMLIHLENKPAFEKVIPSKVFELSTYDKPIVAGVSGFPKIFIEENLSTTFTFQPCSSERLVESILKAQENRNVIDREDFIKTFSRKNINEKMAESILNYLVI